MSDMTLEEAWKEFERVDHDVYGDEHKLCMCGSCIALRRILQDCPKDDLRAAGVRILNESEDPETLVALMECFIKRRYSVDSADKEMDRHLFVLLRHDGVILSLRDALAKQVMDVTT